MLQYKTTVTVLQCHNNAMLQYKNVIILQVTTMLQCNTITMCQQCYNITMSQQCYSVAAKLKQSLAV